MQPLVKEMPAGLMATGRKRRLPGDLEGVILEQVERDRRSSFLKCETGWIPCRLSRGWLDDDGRA
jgi:hypothetical protein